jgi:hypothetical protein
VKDTFTPKLLRRWMGRRVTVLKEVVRTYREEPGSLIGLTLRDLDQEPHTSKTRVAWGEPGWGPKEPRKGWVTGFAYKVEGTITTSYLPNGSRFAKWSGKKRRLVMLVRTKPMEREIFVPMDVEDSIKFGWGRERYLPKG